MLWLHVRCCHISEMYLIFLFMLTMHLINLHLLPQYQIAIAKIVYMMYSKWLLTLGSFCPDMASLACVLRYTPCQCVPRAHPGKRAASDCQKVSSAFLLSLNFIFACPIRKFILSENVPDKTKQLLIMSPIWLAAWVPARARGAAGSLRSSFWLHFMPKLFYVVAELKKALRPGLCCLLIQLSCHH